MLRPVDLRSDAPWKLLTGAVLGGLLQAHLFHGTTEVAIVSICRHGFDPEHASFRTAAGGGGGSGAPKMFGLGLYLASNATKSAQVRQSHSSAELSSAHGCHQSLLFAGA